MKKIFYQLKELLLEYKKSILTVEDKELTATSKVFLFVFVVIIFIIIGKGVDMQQGYIEKPYEQFSYKCINIIDKNIAINKFKNRDVKKDIYGNYYSYKYWDLESFVYNHRRQSERDILLPFGENNLCQELGRKYLDLANSDIFEDKLILQKGLKNKIALFNSKIDTKTKEYSNTLLEDIAKQEKEYSILSTSSKSIKKELKTIRKKLKVLKKELEKVENITNLKEFQAFKSFLDNNTQEILSLRDKALKYYRFKYTINIFVFLFPVWFLFYVGYRTLKRKDFFITSHLSLNVANVSALYIIFNFFLLVYTIIPKVFFGKLILFLSQYNLTLFLNILAIFFFMLVFGVLIRRVQKRDYKDNNAQYANTLLESRRKKIDTCIKCGNMHHKEDVFCGVCSHNLKTTCIQCNEIIESGYKFCPKCSKEKLNN